MKTLINIFLIVLLAGSTTVAAATTPLDHAIHQVETKYRNLFVFKVSGEFRGAKVALYHESGDLVIERALERRRMIIDFCDVAKGTYTIVVSKGKYERTFQYAK